MNDIVLEGTVCEFAEYHGRIEVRLLLHKEHKNMAQNFEGEVSTWRQRDADVRSRQRDEQRPANFGLV